jgi:hypothetical protein
MPSTALPVETKIELRKRLAKAVQSKRGCDYLESIDWQDMRDDVQAALKSIVDGRNQMRAAHRTHMGDHREAVSQDKMSFAIDGRMVGDIGQLIAEQIFAIRLCPQAKIDAVSTVGPERRVQVKATFLDTSLQMKNGDDHLIALQLHEDGRYRVLYNGPAKPALDYLKAPKDHRGGSRAKAGEQLEGISLSTWALLNTAVKDEDRIPRRAVAGAEKRGT